MAGLGDALLGPQQPPDPNKKIEGNPLAANTPGGLKGFLQRPEVMAFMLQSAATMLSNGGIGRGLGEGSAAVGRYEANKAASESDAQKEARRQWEWQQEFDLRKEQVAKSGRGGGGGGGGSAGKPGPTEDPKALAKMLYDQDLASWKAKQKQAADMGEPFTDPMPDILEYHLRAQRIVEAQKNGMNLGMYSGLRSAGRNDQADYIADMFASDPAGAQQMMKEFEAPSAYDPGIAEPPQAPPSAAAPGVIPQIPGMPQSPFQNPYFPGLGDLGIPGMDPLTAPNTASQPWQNFEGTPRKGPSSW